MSIKKKTLLSERLEKGPVICAEGYIFELERRGYVQAGAFVPTVILEHPEVVEQLHKEFLRAGTDVLPALTYYGHREKLKVIGRENDLEKLNRRAVRIAQNAAIGHDILIAANICNTWAYKPDNAEAAAEVKRQYTEQIGWAVDEGIDFVLAETIEYVGEALIAVEVINSFGLESVINFSATFDKSKDGYDWIEACKLVKKAGATVVGFNCARGPETILPLGKKLSKAVDGPISLVPVPYRTTESAPSFQFLKNNEGKSSYTIGLDAHLIDRNEAADFAKEAKDIGVGFIGLCCGAGPQHIRSLAEALGRKTEASEFSANMNLHGLFGNEKTVQNHEIKFLKLWERKTAIKS